MSKIVNISEDKFMKALRRIVESGEFLDPSTNQDPFADQIKEKEDGMEDGHGMIQNDVNNMMTAKGPNDGLDNVVNPNLPK